MRSVKRFLLLLLGWVILTSCQKDSETSVTILLTEALPSPQVIYPTVDENSETSVLESQPVGYLTPTASPIPITELEDDPLALAQSVYGDRLIERILIPGVQVDAPVTVVGWNAETMSTGEFQTDWEDPQAAVGWVLSSALPDDGTGNVILYGHNNIHSSVFRDLYTLLPGDEIKLITSKVAYIYLVDQVYVLPIQNIDDGKDDTRYMKQTRAPRLTLISCYPPEGNDYRVVIVAYPSEENP